MLKIEVIKFEAQDVITASVAAPAECLHSFVNVSDKTVEIDGEIFYEASCDACGAPLLFQPSPTEE